MKVCLVNTFHYRRGGDSTYTFDLAELLRSKGHEVIHFAMKHPRNDPSDFEEYFVNHIDYKQTSEKGNPLRKIAALGRSLYSFEARRKFAKLLDDTEPDIVHLQNFRRHLTFSIVKEAKARGIPVVYTAHDYDPICPNSLLFSDGKICEICQGRHYHRALFRRCKDGSFAGTLALVIEGTFVKVMNYYTYIDMIITPSRFLRRKLLECGFDESRVTAIPNFIDAGRYEPRYGGSGIIYYGRLAPEK
ncbi:MAG TPA: glycosyltransferase family 1 protein, partial [Firmicutes bacterium]|nr:glycosyltransferase family 1 protein [Bacillota bacterium]